MRPKITPSPQIDIINMLKKNNLINKHDSTTQLVGISYGIVCSKGKTERTLTFECETQSGCIKLEFREASFNKMFGLEPSFDSLYKSNSIIIEAKSEAHTEIKNMIFR